MQHTGCNKRIAVTAALGALTALLATGCSFSIGDAEKKNETTASTNAAAPEEQPTAEQPVGDDAEEPDRTGVSKVGAVHKARVALTISDKLAEMTGKRPKLATCPEHLPARVGSTIRCEVTTGSGTFHVTTTVTSVVGKQVKYNFKVDNSVN